jgi:hypothetical protein
MVAQGERGVYLLIHDLGTRWKSVVSVTPRPLFTPGGKHFSQTSRIFVLSSERHM